MARRGSSTEHAAQMFKRLAEDPDSWRDSALTLKKVAELIGETYVTAVEEIQEQLTPIRK